MNLETIRNELRIFVEDFDNMQLSHKAYEYIWQLIQNIDYELDKIQPNTKGVTKGAKKLPEGSNYNTTYEKEEMR